MLCKICNDEYDPNHPYHRGGHIRICGDCEDKTEDEKRKVKGINIRNDSGDFECVKVVDQKTFEKYVQSESDISGIGSEGDE